MGLFRRRKTHQASRQVQGTTPVGHVRIAITIPKPFMSHLQNLVYCPRCYSPRVADVRIARVGNVPVQGGYWVVVGPIPETPVQGLSLGCMHCGHQWTEKGEPRA